MTGTQSHEMMAGVTAAIDYLAELGRRFGQDGSGRQPAGGVAGFELASGEGAAGAAHRDDDPAVRASAGRRLAVQAAMGAIQAYERTLSEKLVNGLLQVPGLTFYGIREAQRFGSRTPTVAVRIAGYTPRQLAELLGKQGIFAWDGNYYALNLTERLGVEDDGGMLRIGLVHYNTAEEIDRLLEALHEVARA
jgi:selenocysteine lyase/cysteine desulfurase